MGEAKRRRERGEGPKTHRTHKTATTKIVRLYGMDFAAPFTSIDGPTADLSKNDIVTLAGITIQLPGIGPAVRETLMRETQRILRKCGPAAFEYPKTSAAIHEAGHVVVHTATGFTVTHSRIEHTPGHGWGGYTNTSDGALAIIDMAANSDTALTLARNLIAGVMAEQAADPDFREGSSLDEVVMSQILAGQAALARSSCKNVMPLDGEQLWREEVWHWTYETLRHHRETHRKITEYLYVHHTLTGNQLTALCDEIRANK